MVRHPHCKLAGDVLRSVMVPDVERSSKEVNGQRRASSMVRPDVEDLLQWLIGFETRVGAVQAMFFSLYDDLIPRTVK